MAQTSWVIESFDKLRHDRTGFDCGVPALNDWLATKISQFEKKNLARTFVLIEPSQALIKGYYALSNHSVVPEDQAKGLPRLDTPVVLIGRLAVDRSVQGQQLGEFLLVDALRRAEFLSHKIGIRAVEAIDQTAQRFYKKFGFVSLKDDPRHLYLPINVIRKLKLPPL